MKYQRLFSEKNKKEYFEVSSAEFFLSMLSIKSSSLISSKCLDGQVVSASYCKSQGPEFEEEFIS